MAAVSYLDHTRTYQQEMFERSMEGNRIIVVGSIQATLQTDSYFRPLDGHGQREDTCVSRSKHPYKSSY